MNENKNESINDDFRDKVTFVVYPNLFKLLITIKNTNNYTYSNLSKLTEFSNGLVYNAIKDLKNMSLITNGIGFNLTNLGEEWINDFNKTNSINNETLKKICLKLPYFNKIYEENKDLTDYKKLFELFSGLAPKDTNPRLIGSITKRYLEGVYNIKINAGSKISRINQKKFKLPNIKINNQEINNNYKNKYIIDAIKIVTEVKKLQDKYGKENIKAVIENL